MKLFTLLLSLLSLSGCAVAPPLQTASGRPEVTIKTANVAKFRSLVISRAMSRGGELISDGPSSLVFSMPMPGGQAFAYQAFLGNASSTVPKKVLTLVFATEGAQTRIFASGKIEMKNAFGGDQSSGSMGGQLMQNDLEDVKRATDL